MPGKVTDEDSSGGVEGYVPIDEANNFLSKTGYNENGSETRTTQIIIDANVKPDSSRKDFDALTEHIIKQLIVDPKSITKIEVHIDSRNDEGFDEATIRTIKENAGNIPSVDREPEFY